MRGACKGGRRFVSPPRQAFFFYSGGVVPPPFLGLSFYSLSCLFVCADTYPAAAGGASIPMFSSRREPAKKHLATATTSRLSATAIPSSSSPVLSPPRPRTIVRVATVTRTTVVKRAPPPPPPRVGPPPATLSKEKRKTEPTTRDASSSKSRKLERPALPKRSAAEHSDEGDDRGARRTEQSSSSEDESRPLVRKKEMPFVVERDASATLDGAVGECVSAEGLVLSLPKAYIQCEFHGNWAVSGRMGAERMYRCMYPGFGDPADATKPPAEWAGAEHPVVTLEYPGDEAQERYALHDGGPLSRPGSSPSYPPGSSCSLRKEVMNMTPLRTSCL